MKKTIARIVALILIFCLLLSTVAFASTTSSAYIAVTSAHFIRSGDTVNIYFTIVGRGLMNEIGVSEIWLYEKNGNSWNWVYTFYASDANYTADMLSYNKKAKAAQRKSSNILKP